MKKIVEYKDGTRSYAIGDVVYLNIEEGKPTCMAEAVKNNDDKPKLRRPHFKTF